MHGLAIAVFVFHSADQVSKSYIFSLLLHLFSSFASVVGFINCTALSMDENFINIVPPAENDQQPKSPGQIISAFLLDHSPTFQELAVLRHEVCELRRETL